MRHNSSKRAVRRDTICAALGLGVGLPAMLAIAEIGGRWIDALFAAAMR